MTETQRQLELEGHLEKKEREQSIDELRNILTEESDSKEIMTLAFAEIMEAVREFNETHPYIQAHSAIGQFDRGPADIRADLAQIQEAVGSAQAKIRALPLPSRRLLAKALRQSFAELDRGLVPLMNAVQEALHKAHDLPDKPSHHARAFLARDVARVMRVVLKKEPTLTRDDPDIKAPYARLLRQTLKVAGIKQVSIGRAMSEGMLLLDNPEQARGDAVKDDETSA